MTEEEHVEDELKFPSSELEDYLKWTRELLEQMKLVQRHRYARINACKSIEDVKAVLIQMNADQFTADDFLLRSIASLNTTLDVLNVCILRLPNKREYDGIRTDLEKTREKVAMTLTPIKEMIDKYKEQLERGDSIYG